jgi:FMN-dependent oxidoreductase (nitrilotriacetate monooxygenase family)
MKPLIFGAFEINQVNLTSQGLWAHPDQTTYRYKDLEYWTGMAKLLEGGGFHFVFLADSYGYPHIKGLTKPVVFEQAVEIPNNDPMLLIPAMAAVTDRLSFAVTASTTYEHPYANARRLATLDHLTKGRIGWNIVTTSMSVVSELFGQELIPHDERYARAEDFVDLTYKLLEGSWDDDAVVVDKEQRLYADPAKVREIHHHGPYHRCDGYFDSEPSPQRTPVLFQAGLSEAGRAFGAAHAEVIFLQGRDEAMVRRQVDDIRARALQAGRPEGSVKTVTTLSIVCGSSRAAADRKLEEYLSYVNYPASAAYYSSTTGIDLAALEELGPDTTFSDIQTEETRSSVARHGDAKVHEAAEHILRYGMRELIVRGSPAEIVEQLGAYVEATEVDGFLLAPFTMPHSYDEFAEEIAPALREAGLLAEQSPGTFRESLFPDGGPHLPPSHPAQAARLAAVGAV